MNAAFLMVLLTTNGAGQVDSSFVSTDTLLQCEQKINMIRALFTSQKIPILEIRCIPSKMRFTPFSHGANAPTDRHAFYTRFDANSVTITSMASIENCQALDPKVEKGKEYCSTSVQKLLAK